jgi:ribA/ribD-fused uncharacterized protein
MIDVSRFQMRGTATHIFFWGGPASQWYLHAPFRQRFVTDGPVFAFNCAEQYMMAAKSLSFGDNASFDRIMSTSDPKEQKRLGRLVNAFNKAVWEATVPNVLVRAGLAKFSQNPDILVWLLSTAGKRLVEGSPSDLIYGVGLRYDDPRIEDPANWLGLNLLGDALEIVRGRLAQPIAGLRTHVAARGADPPWYE